MLTKTVTWLALPPREVRAELRLETISTAFLHAFELASLSFPIGNRSSNDVFKPIFRQEENPIGIAHDEISGCNDVRANDCLAEDVRRSHMQALWTGW